MEQNHRDENLRRSMPVKIALWDFSSVYENRVEVFPLIVFNRWENHLARKSFRQISPRTNKSRGEPSRAETAALEIGAGKSPDYRKSALGKSPDYRKSALGKSAPGTSSGLFSFTALGPQPQPRPRQPTRPTRRSRAPPARCRPPSQRRSHARPSRRRGSS